MTGMHLQVALAAESSLPMGSELSAFLRWCVSGGMAGGALAAAAEQPAGPASPAAGDAFDWADVQASQGGDHEAYARLVRRHQQTIASYMWRFTRQRLTWEELVHDVFVEAYVGLGSYQGRAPFLHWLRRIATRVGYRYWKRRRRQQGRESPLDDAVADAAAARDDGAEASRQAAEVVHGLLARLAPRDRLVMTLMYLEQCTVAEIAQRTGWSETLVKVQAHRARQRLRRICEQRDEYP
jgi:RNA polymerase sigma-70 factor (ECF subfamily)